ncbi:MAG: hypothetical protein IPK68_06265 [Bdellovibrionales bacterium]|nr:hypothetical protein [Bdellovibrionales bacterium]
MKQNSSIVKSENSEKIIFDYHPKTFPLTVSEQTSDFLSAQGSMASDFKISDLVLTQTRMADLQKKGLDDKIEELVLQKVKEFEEKGYREAFELGLIEGRELAFGEKKSEIEEKLVKLDGLLNHFENLRNRFLAENERQLMELLIQVAGRIALRQISDDPQSIFYTLQVVMADIHKDEDITLFVSAEDLATIEEFRKKGGKKAEELKRIKLEIGDGIRSGGCIVETHYGAIDATIEQRIDRVLADLRDRMPKISTSGENS